MMPGSLDSPAPAKQTPTPTAPDVAPWWLWPQMLSLEAPLIATLWLAALAQTHQASLPSYCYWGLGLITWVIYVIDRVGDADTAGPGDVLSHRHAFHHRHRRLLYFAILPLSVVVLLRLALWEIPVPLLWQGVGLSLLGAIYLACFAARPRSTLRAALLAHAMICGSLLIARMPVSLAMRLALAACLGLAAFSAARAPLDQRWRLVIPKEVLGSLLFVLGISAGIHHWSGGDHSLLCAEVIYLWGLAALNMIGIASAEATHHATPTPGSIAHMHPRIIILYPWVIATLLIIATVTPDSGIGSASPTAAIANYTRLAAAALLSLHLARQRFNPETYRALADLALVLPLPLIWWM